MGRPTLKSIKVLKQSLKDKKLTVEDKAVINRSIKLLQGWCTGRIIAIIQ